MTFIMGNTPITSGVNIYGLCNLIADPKDRRDQFISISEELEDYEFKSVVDLRTNIDVMPIYQMNIENIGMSAPCCISSIIYNTLLQKGPQFLVIPSRSYLYYTSIWKHRQLGNLNMSNMIDDKMSLRDYLKALKRFGICDEKKYSFSIETLKNHPSENCFQEGQNFKIDYFRVPVDLRMLKYLLGQDKMLLVSLSVYTSFLEKDVQTTGKLRLPSEIDSFVGVISAVIVGYLENNNCFILRFSLGKYWGDKGYGYLNYDDVQDLVNDIWYLDVSLNQFLPHQFIPQSNFFNVGQGNINMYNPPFHQQHVSNLNNNNDKQLNRRKYMVGGGTG